MSQRIPLFSPRTNSRTRSHFDLLSSSSLMKAVQYTDYSTDPYDLQIVEVTKPQPKAGQLLIRIVYAAMNHLDAIQFAGLMKASNWKMDFPFIPGYEFSGIIEEIGEGVSMITSKTFHVGDEVFGVNWDQGRPNSKNPHSQEPIASCFAEYICISAEKVSHKPKNVSWKVAASMGLAGTVAYQCVQDIGYVMADSRVLVIGGNTLVGNLAIQLAKLRGAFVASVSRSHSHCAAASSSTPQSPLAAQSKGETQNTSSPSKSQHYGDGFNITNTFSSSSSSTNASRSSSQSGKMKRSTSRANGQEVGAGAGGEGIRPVLSHSPSSIIEGVKSNSQDDAGELDRSTQEKSILHRKSSHNNNIELLDFPMVIGNSSSSDDAFNSNNTPGITIDTQTQHPNPSYTHEDNILKADLTIHYDKEDWFRHPDCRGFDFILDAVGEPHTLSILKEADGMIHVGAAYVNLVNPAVGLIPQAHPPFSYARFYCFNQNTSHQDIIATLVEEGKLHIPIRETYPFTSNGVAEMFKTMSSRRHKGKLVLEVSTNTSSNVVASTTSSGAGGAIGSANSPTRVITPRSARR